MDWTAHISCTQHTNKLVVPFEEIHYILAKRCGDGSASLADGFQASEIIRSCNTDNQRLEEFVRSGRVRGFPTVLLFQF